MSDDIGRDSPQENFEESAAEAQVVSKPPPNESSFVNESDIEQNSKEGPPRKSIQSMPYNENFIKTYESSEFEQATPEQLPGMIFGLGQQKQSSGQKSTGKKSIGGPNTFQLSTPDKSEPSLAHL